MKQCSKCKEWKQLEEFHISKKKKDGLSSWCKGCYKDYRIKNKNELLKKGREYYLENKTAVLDRCKKYRENNKEKERVRHKKYRDENKESISKTSKIYYIRNKDVIKQKYIEKFPKIKERKAKYQRTQRGKEVYYKSRKKYLSTPKGKEKAARDAHKRRARSKNLECTLTDKQWNIIIYEQQHNLCAECEKEFNEKRKPTKDHIIPLSLWGPLTFGNVRALCKSCNTSKLNRVYFMRAIYTLLEYNMEI